MNYRAIPKYLLQPAPGLSGRYDCGWAAAWQAVGTPSLPVFIQTGILPWDPPSSGSVDSIHARWL